MLGFVREMTLPYGRLRLVASSTDYQLNEARNLSDSSDNASWMHSVFVPSQALDLDRMVEKKVECSVVKKRTCPECAFQGFGCAVELDRALPNGVYRILWALACGKDPGKSGGYREKMVEATQILDRIRWTSILGKELDDPRERAAGVMPGAKWVRWYYINGARPSKGIAQDWV